jgi:hypothetical protein
MKILIMITFVSIFNCIPDLTSDKNPDKDNAKNQCLIGSLLYLDENGRFYQDADIGILALLSCDLYLNWDSIE